MSFLLDTNILSEWRKPRGDAGVKMWMASQPDALLFTSVLVVGEIRRGAELLRPRDPAQAVVYDIWLAGVEIDLAERVLPITSPIAHAWARLDARRPLPPIDGLIAATALVHGFTLITRNTADFARTGIRLLNPFEVR